MQVRICNRCRASVDAQPSAVAVTLPADDPATNPKAVTDDFIAAIAVSVAVDGVDLCGVCLIAAVVEYALLAMRAAITPKIARKLQARIDEVLGFAVSPAPVDGSGD